MRTAVTLLATSLALVSVLPAQAALAADGGTTGSRTAAVYGPTAQPTIKVVQQLSRQRTVARRNRPAPQATAPVAAPRAGTLPTVEPAPVAAPSGSSAVPTTAGPPTLTARGSFAERPCTRTYPLSGLQQGTSGDAVANGDRMRAVLAAAQPGDCVTVAPGHYRLAGNVEFTVPDVTLKGLGASREDVWFEHTTEMRALFMVKAGGVHLYNFTHRVHGTARSSQGQSGEGNIWVQGGHSGFRAQDVLAWGSRDAAVFLLGVHDFALNRVESRNSMSDAYHISYGSSNGVLYDSVSRNSGDDGIGIVGYGAEGPRTPHHITVVRHHVDGQTWGRGIGLIHTNNITIQGPTLIERSAGAGIILAREAPYGSGSVRAIRVLGELRFRQANTHTTIDHGAIHLSNPTTDGVIEDVLFTGPIVVADTGVLRSVAVSDQVRALGPGRISAEVRNASFYGRGPASKLHTELSAGSVLTTPGWSKTSSYQGAEPAFPLR